MRKTLRREFRMPDGDFLEILDTPQMDVELLEQRRVRIAPVP
jgi:hypothetical protein